MCGDKDRRKKSKLRKNYTIIVVGFRELRIDHWKTISKDTFDNEISISSIEPLLFSVATTIEGGLAWMDWHDLCKINGSKVAWNATRYRFKWSQHSIMSAQKQWISFFIETILIIRTLHWLLLLILYSNQLYSKNKCYCDLCMCKTVNIYESFNANELSIRN